MGCGYHNKWGVQQSLVADRIVSLAFGAGEGQEFGHSLAECCDKCYRDAHVHIKSVGPLGLMFGLYISCRDSHRPYIVDHLTGLPFTTCGSCPLGQVRGGYPGDNHISAFPTPQSQVGKSPTRPEPRLAKLRCSIFSEDRPARGKVVQAGVTC